MSNLVNDIAEKLRELPEGRLQEVLALVESLRERPERGSAEALVGAAGSWALEPRELERLLADVQSAREAELDR